MSSSRLPRNGSYWSSSSPKGAMNSSGSGSQLSFPPSPKGAFSGSSSWARLGRGLPRRMGSSGGSSGRSKRGGESRWERSECLDVTGLRLGEGAGVVDDANGITRLGLGRRFCLGGGGFARKPGAGRFSGIGIGPYSIFRGLANDDFEISKDDASKMGSKGTKLDRTGLRRMLSNVSSGYWIDGGICGGDSAGDGSFSSLRLRPRCDIWIGSNYAIGVDAAGRRRRFLQRSGNAIILFGLARTLCGILASYFLSKLAARFVWALLICIPGISRIQTGPYSFGFFFFSS